MKPGAHPTVVGGLIQYPRLSPRYASMSHRCWSFLNYLVPCKISHQHWGGKVQEVVGTYRIKARNSYPYPLGPVELALLPRRRVPLAFSTCEALSPSRILSGNSFPFLDTLLHIHSVGCPSRIGDVFSIFTCLYRVSERLLKSRTILSRSIAVVLISTG